MRQSRYPDFHSRFDVPDAPASTSWWARVIFQLQRQWLLTFYPHPDSFAYPNRSRLLVVSFLILAGSLILGIYWAPFKYSFFPAYETVLALMAFMGFLFFLKIYFKILPIIKDVFLFPIVLWLSLPFYFFWTSYSYQGGNPHLSIWQLCC